MTQEEKWEVERLYFSEGLSTKEIASDIGLYETDIIYCINKMIKDNPRKGEIRAAAEKAYPYKGGAKGYICESSIPIFIQGAMWADETAWKPNDEQMKALADALSLAKNCGEEWAFDLRTLYEQLKKLKGE